MQVASTIAEIRSAVAAARAEGRRIGCVPTMGALHAGHISLVELARQLSDFVVVTIFVNPTQFGPKEDLSRYPRDEAGDLAKARPAGIDLAFCPSAEAMYPAGSQTFIEVRELQQPLCGASRPGHFAGVATVVSKLFHITRPHLAVFGEKDYQQLAIIRRMVRDLDFGIEIQGVPIVREADGLALSSRNAYLSPEQRVAALSLSRGLAAAEAAVKAGERDAQKIVALARAPIEAESLARIDYAELRDAEELTTIDRIEKRAVLALAVFVGTTRLIDNRVLG
jgi:pantoate--beta-alanine ligase